MKNINPLAPSFWPPTSVFTHPEKRECILESMDTMHGWDLQYGSLYFTFKSKSQIILNFLHVLSFGHSMKKLPFLTNSLTFSFELRQKTPWTLMSNQMAQIMTWIWFVVLLQVWDREGHIQVSNVLDRHDFIKLLWGKKNKKKRKFGNWIRQ